MNNRFLICLCCVFLPFVTALTRTYHSAHFNIRSDLEPSYVKFIQVNTEAYYENIGNRYFPTGWPSQLMIHYYSKQSDTQKLLNDHAINNEVEYSLYVPDMAAVYTHRLMDNGRTNDWNALFEGVVHHFIHSNHHNPPTWFKEGLVGFLSQHTQLVKGTLKTGKPNPPTEQILRDKLEMGLRPSVKQLFSTSTEQFHNWSVGYHFAKTFFNWLDDIGVLKQYLRNTRQRGYDFSVLEQTVYESHGTININVELIKFIKKNCYAGAYLEDSRQAEGEAEKEQALFKALELKPDYPPALLELAKHHYGNNDYEKCRETLQKILSDPWSIEYRRAARLMGDTYYNDKDYAKAIEYYTDAWEYSDYYEYKYRVAYQIGNCHHYLEDPNNTTQWYREFLAGKWEPESMKDCADYAQKYIELMNIETTERQSRQRENIRSYDELGP